MRKVSIFVVNILILLLIGLFLSSCDLLQDFSEWINPTVVVVKKDVDFTPDLLYLSTGKVIHGIDTVNFNERITLRFNTYVTSGNATDDGRLFVSDSGNQIGVWGKQVFVIDNSGSIIHRIPTLPNPTDPVFFGSQLVIPSACWNANGFGFEVFDKETYEPLLRTDTCPDLVSFQEYNGHAYGFGSRVISNTDGSDIYRESMIVDYDIENISIGEVSSSTTKSRDTFQGVITGSEIWMMNVCTLNTPVLKILSADTFDQLYQVNLTELDPSLEGIAFGSIGGRVCSLDDKILLYIVGAFSVEGNSGNDTDYIEKMLIMDTDLRQKDVIVDLKADELMFDSPRLYGCYGTNALFYEGGCDFYVVYDLAAMQFVKKVYFAE